MQMVIIVEIDGNKWLYICRGSLLQRIIVDEKAELFGLTGAWRVYGIYQ